MRMTVLRSRFFLLCFRLREGVCRVSSLGFGVSICGSALPGSSVDNYEDGVPDARENRSKLGLDAVFKRES